MRSLQSLINEDIIFVNISTNCKKAQTFGDQSVADQIMKTSDPAIQKKLGRKVSNFDAVIWSNVSRDIVFRGLMAKFTQIKSLNESEIVNPQCELKCVANTTESFCATIGISEETEAALWAMAEGLEITEGD